MKFSKCHDFRDLNQEELILLIELWLTTTLWITVMERFLSHQDGSGNTRDRKPYAIAQRTRPRHGEAPDQEPD